MSHCQCYDQKQNQNSSFLFGLILGAILGAVIAIIIYKNDKDKVLVMLKAKIETFLKNIISDVSTTDTASRSSKTSKTIKTKRPVLETVTVSAVAPVPVRKSQPKKFFKPKK